MVSRAVERLPLNRYLLIDISGRQDGKLTVCATRNCLRPGQTFVTCPVALEVPMNNANRSAARFLPDLAKSLKGIFTLLCGAVMAFPAAAVQKPVPPDTPKKPVVDHYYGVTVADDYRWLENREDPAVRQWSDAQNDRARRFLDGLAARQPIRKWLLETSNKTSVSYSRIQSRSEEHTSELQSRRELVCRL